MRPGFLGTQVAFGNRYCDPTPAFFGPGFPGSGGLEYRGAARSAELYEKLKNNVMVRANMVKYSRAVPRISRHCAQRRAAREA